MSQDSEPVSAAKGAILEAITVNFVVANLLGELTVIILFMLIQAKAVGGFLFFITTAKCNLLFQNKGEKKWKRQKIVG
nr:hypothetical protein [Fredinandcohnia onubensis]